MRQHPEFRPSEHFFLDLPKLEAALREWLETKKDLWRPNVMAFALNWIREGLHGRAYTRDLNYGVPIPLRGHEDKRIYVWFDAVSAICPQPKSGRAQGDSDAWKDWWLQAEGETAPSRSYYYVEIDGPRGPRSVPAVVFVRGAGHVDLAGDELVVAVTVPRPRGPSGYAKAGARNAMARAVCGVAVRLDAGARTVAVCIVGCAPRAVAATLAWDTDGELDVPGIDDERASAAHRRHVARVLTARVLARTREELPAWT